MTYVHEKDDGPADPDVDRAFREINRTKPEIVCNIIDDDVVTGTNQVPRQHKIAIETSKTEGIPILVAQSGESVVKTLKGDLTYDQVMELVP